MRCIALLSGGLDSMLAIRMMQEQDIEVEALNFKTVFTCCQDQSAQAAHDLGVRLTVISQDDDYLDLVKRPKFGYGKGANPCVDCRIYMFDKALKFMEQVDAKFIISGEVVGQRPMSQKRNDLDVISHNSGCDDLLLRPLSARVLPPTLPEREGWVDRERLFGINGRSRKQLIELAHHYGLKEIPTPSTGCTLTEPRFSEMVHDLIELKPKSERWDFELLKNGRHFRFDDQTKIVIGRNEQENAALEYSHRLPDAESTALLEPESFFGPVGLIVGPPTEAAIERAAGLLLRYARGDETTGEVRVTVNGEEDILVTARVSAELESAQTIASREPRRRRKLGA